MTKSLPKLVLSSSRDIPFSQLVLSQKNVRRVKAGLSIEDLADDIYHRTLLQSLNVRAMVGDDGKETGMFEVPAGGRRFRALELLVKSKRMAKDQPVPCVVRDAGIAEEDSLAENVMRVGLHPLDQFRAFSALIEAGLSEDDIAARFFVSGQTVRQRLRLASVSPTRRGTGKANYERLKAGLDRLQSTTIATSIRQQGARRRHRFSWINEWKERLDGSGRALGIQMIVPDWFYEGVIDQALVLTIDPAYFALTGGLERWLYRLVRKHGGKQKGGWSFDFQHLHMKSGALSPPTRQLRRALFRRAAHHASHRPRDTDLDR